MPSNYSDGRRGHFNKSYLFCCSLNLPSTSSGSFVSEPIPDKDTSESGTFISQPIQEHSDNIHLNEVSNNDVQASPLQQLPERFTGRKISGRVSKNI